MNHRRCAVPAFGRMPLDRIGPEDVAAWFDGARRDKPGAANRALEILRAMMFRADEWGLRERGTNPYLGIAKNPRKQVARLLDMDELARLGRALDANEAEWPEAVAAIRLLALTGCRRGEVLDLRWRDIGGDVIKLTDTKTGPRTLWFGPEAVDVLTALPRRDGVAQVFPEDLTSARLYAFWVAVREEAGLPGVRLHDARHTYASQGVMNGVGLAPPWASCSGTASAPSTPISTIRRFAPPPPEPLLSSLAPWAIGWSCRTWPTK